MLFKRLEIHSSEQQIFSSVEKKDTKSTWTNFLILSYVQWFKRQVEFFTFYVDSSSATWLLRSCITDLVRTVIKNWIEIFSSIHTGQQIVI